MRNTIMIVGALTLIAAGCGNKKDEANKMEANKMEAPKATTPDPTPPKPEEPTPTAATTKKLFLDVHELGPGKVTAAAAAEVHKKDLATQGKYGVDFKAYWLDEKEGKVYCLAEAPSAEVFQDVHKEAHGMLANKVMEVSADTMNWTPEPGKKLFLDVHHFGPGKVGPDDVAGAHKKDLEAQSKHDAKFLNYYFDKDSGTVMCLVEAAKADDALAVHKEAHGLMPDSIAEVTEGR